MLDSKEIRIFFTTGNRKVGYIYRCRDEDCQVKAHSLSEANDHFNQHDAPWVEQIYLSSSMNLAEYDRKHTVANLIDVRHEVPLAPAVKLEELPASPSAIPNLIQEDRELEMTVDFVNWVVTQWNDSKTRCAELERQLKEKSESLDRYRNARLSDEAVKVYEDYQKGR